MTSPTLRCMASQMSCIVLGQEVTKGNDKATGKRDEADDPLVHATDTPRKQAVVISLGTRTTATEQALVTSFMEQDFIDKTMVACGTPKSVHRLASSDWWKSCHTSTGSAREEPEGHKRDTTMFNNRKARTKAGKAGNAIIASTAVSVALESFLHAQLPRYPFPGRCFVYAFTGNLPSAKAGNASYKATATNGMTVSEQFNTGTSACSVGTTCIVRIPVVCEGKVAHGKIGLVGDSRPCRRAKANSCYCLKLPRAVI